MKIGIGQINTRVGDFEANAKKILTACESFAAQGADFAVFPESAISGYPIKDLVFYEKFVETAQKVLTSLASKLPLPRLSAVRGYAKARSASEIRRIGLKTAKSSTFATNTFCPITAP